MPFAMIDFDNVHAGDPADDAAYALRVFLGYGLVNEDAHDLVRRTKAMVDAYGRSFDTAAILERGYGLAEERCHEHGWHRQLAKLCAERAWLLANRRLLSPPVARLEALRAS